MYAENYRAMHTAVNIAHWGIVGLSVAAAFASDLRVVLADGVWLGGVMLHWLCNDNTSARSFVHHRTPYATLQSVFQNVTRMAVTFSVQSVFRGRT